MPPRPVRSAPENNQLVVGLLVTLIAMQAIGLVMQGVWEYRFQSFISTARESFEDFRKSMNETPDFLNE